MRGVLTAVEFTPEVRRAVWSMRDERRKIRCPNCQQIPSDHGESIIDHHDNDRWLCSQPDPIEGERFDLGAA